MENSLNLTEQLQRFSDGDREIAEALLRQVLPELHRMRFASWAGALHRTLQPN